MGLHTKLSWIATDPKYRRFIWHTALRRVGYELEHWGRIVQIRRWKAFLAEIGSGGKNALEISPQKRRMWRDLPWASYRTVQYPDFDICSMTLPERFDVVIADNVFEHLREPLAATRNVHAMLAEGGVFLLCTPFFVRVHGSPDDYHRWTTDGMRALLQDAGFEPDDIVVESWGNKACARAYLRDTTYPRYGWGRSLKNEPNFPMSVWAFARR